VVDITAALVRQLVREQFPQWADLPVTAVSRQGWDNRTYRLGAELSVRLPSAEGYADGINKEDRCLPLLAYRLPVGLPEPVATGAPSPDYPFRWSIRRWLRATPSMSPRMWTGCGWPRISAPKETCLLSTAGSRG
jgi:aminoglycoside phosphotransferase (APT) family kinase protein